MREILKDFKSFDFNLRHGVAIQISQVSNVFFTLPCQLVGFATFGNFCEKKIPSCFWVCSQKNFLKYTFVKYRAKYPCR
jgi:hypothetical protein